MAFKQLLNVGLGLWLFSAAAQATVIEVSNLDSGWYLSDGSHDRTITNYLAGNCCEGGVHNNFFVFDLTGINNIVSATLQIYTGTITAPGRYELWDVSTPVNELQAGGSDKIDTFIDLGSGVSFGGQDLLQSQTKQLIDITLNADAIRSLNASSGFWAIGGSYSAQGAHQFAFGVTELRRSNKLLLTMSVFEPSTFALMGLGLTGLGLTRLASRKR